MTSTLQSLLSSTPPNIKLGEFHKSLEGARFPAWYKFKTGIFSEVNRRTLAKLEDITALRRQMYALLDVGGVDARIAMRMLIALAGFQSLAEVLEERGRE